MKRHNYIRSFRRWVDRHGQDKLSEHFHSLGVNLPQVMRQLEISQKFALPDGGCVIEGSAIKTLVEPELVRMPYTITSLEYHATPKYGEEDDMVLVSCLPRILLVSDYEGKIRLRGIWRYDNGYWNVTPQLQLEVGGIVEVAKAGDSIKKNPKQWTLNNSVYVPLIYDHQPTISNDKIDLHVKNIRRDLEEELGVVLRLMAALSCSNVAVESIPVSRIHSRAKGPLKYDSYHCLSIGRNGSSSNSSDADGRSPREHLRRGHIRNLHGGGRVWVNSTIVNPGVGGKVTKDYKVAI